MFLDLAEQNDFRLPLDEYVRVCMYVCMHACMHVYICIYMKAFEIKVVTHKYIRKTSVGCNRDERNQCGVTEMKAVTYSAETRAHTHM